MEAAIFIGILLGTAMIAIPLLYAAFLYSVVGAIYGACWLFEKYCAFSNERKAKKSEFKWSDK